MISVGPATDPRELEVKSPALASSMAQQKTMAHTGNGVKPHDLAGSVDLEKRGKACAGHINRGETALA